MNAEKKREDHKSRDSRGRAKILPRFMPKSKGPDTLPKAANPGTEGQESINPEGESSDQESAKAVTAAIDAKREHVRGKKELLMCRTYYKGVPMYGDTEEARYRAVLEEYEKYMAFYESLAIAESWSKHYGHIQSEIDKALGIRSNMTETELKNALGKIGCITIFGCGYNPTRELSNKLKKAIINGYIRLVLVDFSKKALKSAINYLHNQGIIASATYQMDLTMGKAGHVDAYSKNLLSASGENIMESLDTYIDLVSDKVDLMIEIFRNDGGPPGTFMRYLMAEEDKPGLAVSSMVFSASFLTIYERLLRVIKGNAEDSEHEKRLTAKAEEIHAKFNAFIVQLGTKQMLGLCKEDGSALVIADVNKIALGLDFDPHQNHDAKTRKTQEGRAKKIREAYETDEDKALKRFESLSVTPRISREGNVTELLGDIITATPLDNHDIKITDSERKWAWWDEPLNHGHKVHSALVSTKKKDKLDALDLLHSIPSDEAKSCDAKTCANIILKNIKEQTEANSTNVAGLIWLRSLAIPNIEIDSETLEKYQPYGLKSAMELLELVPKTVLEQGWEATGEYLHTKLRPKINQWKKDEKTMDYIKTGLYWLNELITSI